MKFDRPHHPTGVQERASSAGLSARGNNEYAALAAQLEARAERLRNNAPVEPRLDLEEEEEPLRPALSSLASSFRFGPILAGTFLLAFIGVAVLAVLALRHQPSAPAPTGQVEEAKARAPSPPAASAEEKAPERPPAAPRVAAPAPPPPTAAPGPAQPPAAAPAPPVAAMPAPAPTPSPASTGPLTPDEIRELQGRLRDLGFNPGAVDGAIGAQTRNAARRYAESRALPNTDATRELLARLKTEAPPQQADKPASTEQAAAPPPLTRDDVRDLQEGLKAAGFSPGSTDGAMGSRTRDALQKYADSRGLDRADAARELLARQKEAPASR